MKLSKPIQIALVIIVVISILGFAGWKLGYVEVLKTAIEIQKQRSASKEDKEILNKVSKIIDLPTDIIPVMAVVTDPEALQKEHPTLFKKAQKGDKIIIYPNTIIVYSVSEN